MQAGRRVTRKQAEMRTDALMLVAKAAVEVVEATRAQDGARLKAAITGLDKVLAAADAVFAVQGLKGVTGQTGEPAVFVRDAPRIITTGGVR